MIEIKQISRNFRTKRALIDIDFSIPKNSFIYLSGPNGSGKSTLLKILGGQLEPTSGDIELSGRSISNFGSQWRKNIAFLLADDNVFIPQLNGSENINIFNRFFGQRTQDTSCNLKTVLTYLSWESALSTNYGVASTGTRQKIKLLYAFSRPSQLLLLDEPFHGLDKESCLQLTEYLKHIRSHQTIIYTDHGEHDLSKFATHNLRLKDGVLY